MDLGRSGVIRGMQIVKRISLNVKMVSVGLNVLSEIL